MDKKEFIATVMAMYPQSFTKENQNLWMEIYLDFFPDDLDFQELFDDLLVNYQDKKIAPSTAFFTPYIQKQKARKHKQSETFQKLELWKKEREEIEKHDRPITSPILSPLEVLKKSSAESGICFTNIEMKTLKNYVRTIPTENLRINFWRQVCSLILGGKTNELCRDM